MIKVSDIRKYLDVGVDGRYLSFFRIVFGIVLLKESHRILSSIYVFYIEPDLQIKWPFIEWIPLLPEGVMNVMGYLIAFLALFVIFGLYSNIASFFIAIIYGYFLFLDQSFYNNHYYLIFLLLLIFSISSQDNNWSVSKKLKNINGLIPVWNIVLFRFQFAIVYWFGAFAKLNKDWLNGKTMEASVDAGAYASLIQKVNIDKEIMTLFLTHGGWIFDFICPFFLLNKSFRNIILPFIVIFHIINMNNLNIGVFPILMMFGTILFWGKGLIEVVKVVQNNTFVESNNWVKRIACLYMIFQIIFPLRHWFLKGDYNITGEGYCFSWKMKGNAIELNKYELYIIDNVKNDTLNLELNLHQKQFNRLYTSPATNIYIAHYLEKKIIDNLKYKKGEISVYASIKVNINKRGSRYLIDNKIDLLKYNFSSLNKVGEIIIY